MRSKVERWDLPLLGLAALGALVSCAGSGSKQASVDEHGGVVAQASTAPSARVERLVPWGDGSSGVKLLPPGHQQVAEGPNAVALGPDGRPLVLDRLAERIVAVDDEGTLRPIASVARDVEDLGSSNDGSLVAWSPLRAEALVFAPGSSTPRPMAVPRELHMLTRLSIGPSLRLRAHTGYQELLDLGSPSVPQSLAAALRTIRPGAEMLPDGRGVRCLVDGGAAELQVVDRTAPEGRAQVVARHPLPVGIKAARVVGVDGTTTCLRLETVTSTPTVSVDRRALCLDAATGATVLDEPLGKPGLYVPRTELAVGGGRLAFIKPTEEGLRLTTWPLATEQGKEVTP